MGRFALQALLLFFLTPLLAAQAASEMEFPVRGLHLAAPVPSQLPALLRFIREGLPREGVNVLVIEIGYNFKFASYPQLSAEGSLSREEVGRLVTAAREAGIEVIPLFNCLGHQSWAARTFPLLTEFPGFDETPGLYPANRDIYCRSYCPRHPDVHTVLFSLIDELAEAFQAGAFHVGMDEVFLLGEESCHRCRGEDKAVLFAEEVHRLHEHLRTKGLRMWMWGDRLIDGKATGIGKWEASENETAGAIDLIPNDIVIADWHYEFSPPTFGYFALKGFPVVASPWRRPEAALNHLEQMRLLRSQGPAPLRERALGVLQTTWTDPGRFIQAYFGELEATDQNRSALEAAQCFKELFSRIKP